MILLNIYKSFEFWILRKLGFIKFGKLGVNSIVKYGLYGESENIFFGDYVYVGENCNFWGLGGINIGCGTIIAPNVVIRSSNHNYKYGDYIPYSPEIEFKKVTIGDNCWIGDAVNITPGSIIGEGSIIGMGAVVSGKIEPFSIVVGNPGKVIKKRDIKTYNKLKNEGKIYLKAKNEGKI